jgi:HEAT repeat protein
MMNRLLAIIVISTAGWLHAADLAYPDFTSALKAADAATTFQTAEPIYASLPNYPMRCSDAQVALEWSGKVKFDPASDMQMQVSSRRAEYVSKALAHSTTADCQEFISKNLKKETRFLMPVVAQMAMMRMNSREKLFEAGLNAGRIRALIAAAGDGKNVGAVETLRSIQTGSSMYSEEAVYALGHIGQAEDLDRFIEILKKNPRARIRIAEFGAPAIDRVMKEVNDPNVPENEKNSLIGAIAHSGGHESFPAYVRLLNHPNQFVARMAAEGIARVAEKSDVDFIRDTMLHSAQEETRSNAIQALKSEKVWSPELAQVIIDALSNDPSWLVKSTAATALAERKVCAGIPALQEANKSQNKWVSGPAAAALKQLNGDYDDILLMPLHDATREQLLTDGAPSAPPQKRFIAGHKLVHAGYRDEAFPILKDVALGGKGDRITRYDCLYDLWQMGDDRSKGVMESALQVPDLKESAQSFLDRWQKGCRGYEKGG